MQLAPAPSGKNGGALETRRHQFVSHGPLIHASSCCLALVREDFTECHRTARRERPV